MSKNKSIYSFKFLILKFKNITIYRILTVLLSPLLDIFLISRVLKGKEDKKRFLERLGYSKIKRPDGKLIWFHCASVGESNSVIELIKEISEKHKDKTILFTSGSKTSAENIFKKTNGTGIIHQYIPMDKYFVVRRFLKHWRPNIFITIESEIWPNIITMTSKVAKVVIINGKMSEKSFLQWQQMPQIKKQVFSSIHTCFPQSKVDEQRFIDLGISNTKFLGNLKFDVAPLECDNNKLEELKEIIGTRENSVLFASTHDKEEALIAQIHLNLKKERKDILSIIVLRHPNRMEDVYKILTYDFGLNVKIRSKGEKIDPNTDIYLCDTMGEMGLFFTFFEIVIMCGSLVDKIGGHTPVEPGKLNCAILSGEYVSNNKSLFQELLKDNACILVQDKGEIVNNMRKEILLLLNNQARVDKLKSSAIKTLNNMPNIKENLIKEVEILID